MITLSTLNTLILCTCPEQPDRNWDMGAMVSRVVEKFYIDFYVFTLLGMAFLCEKYY